MADRISHSQSSPPDHLVRAEGLFSAIAPIYDLILGPALTRLYNNAIERGSFPLLRPHELIDSSTELQLLSVYWVSINVMVRPIRSSGFREDFVISPTT